MSFHNCVLLVVVSALFLGSAFAVALPRKLSQPDDLILELCNKTLYVDICIKSVTENLKGAPTGISILEAEINASINVTKVALAQVATLTRSASKEEKQVLDICKKMFESAVSNLNDAKTAIKSRDAFSLNDLLGTVLTDVTICEDTYAESSIPSRLKEVDQLLGHLGSNNLKISVAIVL